jgi:hypothetical protein
MNHKRLFITASAVAVIIIFLLIGWAWVLLTSQPLNVPIATWLPWPVVCSTRGCITARDWQRQQTAVALFAQRSKREQLSPVESLTTLARQHLAHYGQFKSPVTDAAAARYREEILNGTDENKIKEATGLSIADYDELVVKPFLEQESLRQQRRAETAEDLYKQLANERTIIVLPRNLTWNKQEAKVIAQ